MPKLHMYSKFNNPGEKAAKLGEIAFYLLRGLAKNAVADFGSGAIKLAVREAHDINIYELSAKALKKAKVSATQLQKFTQIMDAYIGFQAKHKEVQETLAADSNAVVDIEAAYGEDLDKICKLGELDMVQLGGVYLRDEALVAALAERGVTVVPENQLMTGAQRVALAAQTGCKPKTGMIDNGLGHTIHVTGPLIYALDKALNIAVNDTRKYLEDTLINKIVFGMIGATANKDLFANMLGSMGLAPDQVESITLNAGRSNPSFGVRTIDGQVHFASWQASDTKALKAEIRRTVPAIAELDALIEASAKIFLSVAVADGAELNPKLEAAARAQAETQLAANIKAVATSLLSMPELEMAIAADMLVRGDFSQKSAPTKDVEAEDQRANVYATNARFVKEMMAPQLPPAVADQSDAEPAVAKAKAKETNPAHTSSAVFSNANAAAMVRQQQEQLERATEEKKVTSTVSNGTVK